MRASLPNAYFIIDFCALGEQGKVDESMREMAAIEALKSEKADKEVRLLILRQDMGFY